MRFLQKPSVSIVLVSILMVFGAISIAKTSPSSKQDDIHTLLRLMHARELVEQTMDQMIMAVRRQVPNLTPEMWEEIKTELNFDDLVESYVPVYDKYLSEEEIQGLITFYKSDVGRQFVEAQPKINLETMKIGQAWGQKLNQLVMSKMGY